MYRSIMLPLDGSRFGEQALQLAATLARRSGARLELVHVHNVAADVTAWEPLTPYRYEGLDISEREWDGAVWSSEEEYLTSQANNAGAAVADMAICKVLQGAVVPALEREIELTDPDLIVMATHGRGGVSRAWLGSVADALVRQIHKPILLVRAPWSDAAATPAKTGNILVALDGSTLAESIVPHALQLGAGVPTNFTLLRVVSPVFIAPEMMSQPDLVSVQELRDRITEAREYLNALASVMRSDTVNVKCEVVVGSKPASTILAYAREHDVDVIAMATHGRGGLKRLVLGSVADKVLRAAEVPMLVYQPWWTNG
jgi:nucleotide-binding universal stress UspA family protein